MKLDRNIKNDGTGKYALIKLRVDKPLLTPGHFHTYSVKAEAVDFGDTPETDFFVIRLKDKYAYCALMAYAIEASKDDPEYASEIFTLADLASRNENRKPD